MSNSSPVIDAIDAACGTMARIFDEDGMPQWPAAVWPVAELGFHRIATESHVPGRHLYALLLAESLGRPIEESAVRAHREALFFSYSGGIPLPLNRDERTSTVATVFMPHNIREGFHGLHALARYRGDGQALATIEQSVAFILDHWDPVEGWDSRLAVDPLDFEGSGSGRQTVAGIGRALGPLVKIFDLTGDDAVRRLVDRIATKLLSDHYLRDGNYELDRLSFHVHSVTSSLSSLAQYARYFRDGQARAAVKAFYDNGAWAVRDQLGWSAELFTAPDPHTDRGETNSTGDLLETALVLADDGDTAYLDDAERMIFSHLLPSQIVDVSPFSDHPDETLRKLAGSWGFPAPYGLLPVGGSMVDVATDVVGGTASSLCVAVSESVRVERGVPTVRLYLDAEREGVRASLSGGTARVAADAPDVAIRVPRFDGSSGGYRSVDPRVQREVSFPVERETIVLRHPQRDIRARVFGSRVEAMDVFGTPFAFFPEWAAS
jgi:hypothetical protein